MSLAGVSQHNNRKSVVDSLPDLVLMRRLALLKCHVQRPTDWAIRQVIDTSTRWACTADRLHLAKKQNEAFWYPDCNDMGAQ